MDRHDYPVGNDLDSDDLNSDDLDGDHLDEDTGMIGSETQEPGPGRDERLTNPDPSEVSTEAPTAPAAMSEEDPERTRLGAQERE